MLAESFPEIAPGQRLQAVVRQKRLPQIHAAEGGDLGQRQDAGLDRRDPAGQTVAALLDPQCRASGDQDTSLGVVDERLELRRPVVEVLDLVEDQVGVLTAAGDGVERRSEHRLLVPVRQAQDRLAELLDVGDLVGLDAKDVARRDASLQEVLDHMELGRGLADLTRTADDDRRSEAHVQAAVDLSDEMAPRRGQGRRLAVLPPWIHAPQIADHGVGELDGREIEDRRHRNESTPR